jgi:hypothetical protein
VLLQSEQQCLLHTSYYLTGKIFITSLLNVLDAYRYIHAYTYPHFNNMSARKVR